jgi:phospholipid/cholesterol/gamma-HCH transport system substrate-binding protein
LKISNESKIGALTAIAITLVILGYNYMANEGDFFKPKAFYMVEYDFAPGLGKGNKVTLNGYKIGFVHNISYDPKSNKIVTTVKITEKIQIPVNSIAQIISEDILGSRAIKIIFDETNEKQQRYLESGQKLLPSIEISKLDELSRTVDPMVHKVEDMLEYMDSVIVQSGMLKNSINKTTEMFASIQKASDDASELIRRNQAAIASSMLNIKQITDAFNSQKQEILATITELKKFATDLNNTDLVLKLDRSVANIESITTKMDNGTGSLGKLVNDDRLVLELEATLNELSTILKDLNKYPEKYVPMPWGKKERRKAKELSSKEPYNN